MAKAKSKKNQSSVLVQTMLVEFAAHGLDTTLHERKNDVQKRRGPGRYQKDSNKAA